MILSTEVTLPLRVKSMEQQFQEGRGPVNIYTLELDVKQARAITEAYAKSEADKGYDPPKPKSTPVPWIIVQELKIACEEFLPIGVGDLFSVDLVPRDAMEEVPSVLDAIYAAFFGTGSVGGRDFEPDDEQ